jgi:hypothetical protein
VANGRRAGRSTRTFPSASRILAFTRTQSGCCGDQRTAAIPAAAWIGRFHISQGPSVRAAGRDGDAGHVGYVSLTRPRVSDPRGTCTRVSFGLLYSAPLRSCVAAVLGGRVDVGDSPRVRAVSCEPRALPLRQGSCAFQGRHNPECSTRGSTWAHSRWLARSARESVPGRVLAMRW